MLRRRLLLSNQYPAWLWAAYANVGIPSTAMHFDQGYAWDGVKQVPFNALAACARSTEETTLLPSSPAGKAYLVIPANTLAIDSGLGCQIFLASAGNSFALPMAPADQTIVLLAGTYTFWVNGLTYCDIAAGTAVGTGFGRCVTGTPVTIIISVGGTITCTVGIAGQLMAAQLEPGTFGTPFMRVTGAPRSADLVTLIGAAQTAALNAKAAFFKTQLNLLPSGATNRYLEFTGGSLLLSNLNANVITTFNSQSAIATIGGGGTIAGRVNAAYGFDSVSMTAVANGGTKAISVNPWSGNTGPVYLGNHLAKDRSVNGFVLRAALGQTKGMFDSLAVAP